MAARLYPHIVLASALTPFLLLRTRLSTLYTIYLLRKFALYAFKSRLYIGYFPLVIPVIKIFSAGRAFLRQPLRAIRAIPHNFAKNIIVIDSCFAPQFVPGSEDVGRTGLNIYELLRDYNIRAKAAVGSSSTLLEQIKLTTVLLSMVYPVIAVAVAYRWAMKSTAVLWLPLIWIVVQARPGADVIARLVVMTRSAWSKAMRAYSAIVALDFIAKLALLFGMWKLANLDWLGPLGVAATRLAAPLDLPLWQAAGALNAVLVWVFFFHADQHLLAQGTAEAWSEDSIRREYAIFQAVRTILTLYVIACTFYIAAAVAWQTEWPPIRFVLFPWSA